MIFVVDIGNTNIVMGVYQEKTLLHFWRVSTDIKKTSDEYLITVKNLFQINGIDPTSITNTILGSVVSPLDSVFQEVIRFLSQKEARLVDLSCFPNMPVRMDFPKEVGADRLLNASAGYEIYGGPLIIIDFGTATTFDVISEKGEYLGGAIATGLVLSLEALTAKAFKLPRIELEQPPSACLVEDTLRLHASIEFGSHFAGYLREV